MYNLRATYRRVPNIAVVSILNPTATLLSTFSTLFCILTLLHLHWEVNKFFVQYASVKCSHKHLRLHNCSESHVNCLKVATTLCISVGEPNSHVISWVPA